MSELIDPFSFFYSFFLKPCPRGSIAWRVRAGASFADSVDASRAKSPAGRVAGRVALLGCSAVALHVCLSHVHEEMLRHTEVLPISLASLRSAFGAFRASKFLTSPQNFCVTFSTCAVIVQSHVIPGPPSRTCARISYTVFCSGSKSS